jgi:hypothetical protein
MRVAADTTRGSAEYTPSTSEQISQYSASSAAAIATAVVSLPPRPSVVTFFLVRDALVSCDDDDFSACELVLDAKRPHLDDARVNVPIVGDDAGLAAGKTDRVATALANRHREQRHRDAFAGREQHVELTAIGIRRDFLRQRQQIVGRISHRGDHNHDVVAELARGHNALGDLSQLVRVGDAAAPILLNDNCHPHIIRSFAVEGGS